MAKKRIGTTVCPRCRVRSPVRLEPGQVCDACASAMAWDVAAGDEHLVISVEDIEEMEAAQQEAGGPDHHWLGRIGLTVVAWVALVAGIGAFMGLMKPVPIGPLDGIVGHMASLSWGVLGAGVLGITASVWALVRLRKASYFRSWPDWVAAFVAILGSGMLVLIGTLFVLQYGSSAWSHNSMPPLDEHVSDQAVLERIQRATVAIVAPDAAGDTRMPAMGAGAVIANTEGFSWIVTCSHVAMPYAAVSSVRDADKAPDVWVLFADGTQGRGVVRWVGQPPLDVAVVQATHADPPGPVPVARDTERVAANRPTVFVPNPLRDGWLIHYGRVTRRKTHVTPAGSFALVHTDLPVQPGDSGSGLFDTTGELVGINTWLSDAEAISLPSEAMRVIVDAIEGDWLERLDDPMLLGKREE